MARCDPVSKVIELQDPDNMNSRYHSRITCADGQEITLITGQETQEVQAFSVFQSPRCNLFLL